MGSERRLADTLLWRRLDLPGHEICWLWSTRGGWELTGSAVFLHDERPCKLDYRIRCDEEWITDSARIRGLVGSEPIAIAISRMQGRWWLNDVESVEVEACTDVDLGFSPSTNLLPIRRLDLAPGRKAKVKAAWLPFPTLTLEVLSQEYTRLDEASYRYESAGGAFVRTLTVNRSGFVTDYPGLWEAEHASL